MTEPLGTALQPALCHRAALLLCSPGDVSHDGISLAAWKPQPSSHHLDFTGNVFGENYLFPLARVFPSRVQLNRCSGIHLFNKHTHSTFYSDFSKCGLLTTGHGIVERAGHWKMQIPGPCPSAVESDSGTGRSLGVHHRGCSTSRISMGYLISNSKSKTPSKSGGCLKAPSGEIKAGLGWRLLI